MQRYVAVGTVLAAMLAGFSDARGEEAHKAAFGKVHMSPNYYAEGAGAGDFNQDGVMDVVCGPVWYEGPQYKSRHKIYEPAAESQDGVFPNDRGYSDNFFSYGYDVNGDGWTDIVTLGFPGTPAHWYENPRNQGAWKKHVAFAGVDNESPEFADLTGDGRPEIVCTYQRKLGYAEIDPENPTAEWTWRPISESGEWTRFTHGLGFGDVNSDGRNDILTSTGWHEQPESLEGDPIWEPHAFPFCKGGAQMYAYDVDGDGDNDVVTSLMAHAYGLSWFENVSDEKGEISFKEHRIMNEQPGDDPAGVSFSQLHAVALHDMDGDGLKDIVTGKCYFAHNGKDPGAFDPAVLYYFRLERNKEGAKFVPVLIDDNSGVGRQVTITDLNGDQKPDIVVANKKGVFAFQQLTTDGRSPETEP